jgi:UDPglucose 6-dehydrogenase
MRARHGVERGAEPNRQVQIGAVLATQYRQATDPRSSAAPAPLAAAIRTGIATATEARSPPQRQAHRQIKFRRLSADSRRHRHPVPVGTGRRVAEIVRSARPDLDFDVASNPEFLREGSAIGDFMRPDRVVIGTECERARAVLRRLYRPLYLIEAPIVFTGIETAELTKYAANAFLAMRVTFINEMADLCEKVGADVHDVARGIGLDGRIGRKFLHPGPGYGGSCFPKDTLALMRTAQDYGAPSRLVEATVAVNDARKAHMATRVIEACGGSVRGKTIAALGLTFKPETDDMRDAPSLSILARLAGDGAAIRAFDPEGMQQARPMLPENVTYCRDAFDAALGADALVLITEWNEFRALSPARLRDTMRGRVVVDLRNVCDPAAMQRAGFEYHCVGRPSTGGFLGQVDENGRGSWGSEFTRCYGAGDEEMAPSSR